jgi:nicotinate-nucleotide pyrophosphorylase (carboxylating)
VEITMDDRPVQFGDRERCNALALISLAMKEDLGEVGDITSSATIPSDARGGARLVARSSGVLAGLPVVERVVAEFGLIKHWETYRIDGERIERGSVIARLAGPMRALLAWERTALNFLQRLSGIATLTSRYVAAVAGTRAAIYDTRKTTPGWRALEKYAVRCGGGVNHRFGLYDAVLIKDNHLAWLQTAARPSAQDRMAVAIASARANTPRGTTIEIEVDSLEQFDRVLGCAPDIVLIDNLGPELVAEAVSRRDILAPSIQLEASGGINLDTVSLMAQTGVDRISVGALTHSAPALDVALDFEVEPGQVPLGDPTECTAGRGS